MATSMASGARAAASRAPSAPRGRPTSLGGRDRSNGSKVVPTLQSQLTTAQGALQGKMDARLQDEIRLLTARYSGDAALAERVARGRMSRDFAASDPGFAGEIAPLRTKVAGLEERMRRFAQRRGAGVIGVNGGDILGGN